MAEGVSKVSEKGDVELPPPAAVEVKEMVSELTALGSEFRKLLDPERVSKTPTSDIMLSPIECQLLQREETEALNAIFGSEFQPLNETRSCFLIHICSQSGDIKDGDAINIWFCLPPNYPCIPPVFEIETNQSRSLSYRDADQLYDLLVVECINAVGRGVIYELVSIARDFVAELLQRREQDLLKQKDAALKESKTQNDMLTEDEGLSPTDHDKQFYSDDMFYKPSHFIGSVRNMLEKIPSGLQVTHIENILRQDLAYRFKHTLNIISAAMWKKQRANPHQYKLEPQIAFHGTRMDVLPSIVQKGLIIPGHDGVEVLHGSSHGVGIYLSPDPSFSLGYSDGGQLIVCACVLGFNFYSHKSKTGAGGRYFTVISSCEKEWVFFNASQVLPCYVIRLQHTGAANTEMTHQLPPLLQKYQEEDKLKEDNAKKKQEKLLARANKFLPYGFGPGSRTIIEDAGEIDDDEEDYGEYQLLRYTDGSNETAHEDIIETSSLQYYRHAS